MKMRISCFISVVIFSICFISSVNAIPSTHTVFGFAFLNGDPAPIGSVIIAKDMNGTELANSSVTTDDGLYGFLDIPGDNPDTPEDEGAVNGETISFYLDGIKSNETLVWHVDETGMNYTELNLTFFNVTELPPCEIETYAVNLEVNAQYYLPNSTVFISGALLNSTCEFLSNETITLEIVYQNTSQNVTVFYDEVITNDTGQFFTSFHLDENASKGNYTIYAYYQNITNKTSFLVVLCDDCDNDGFTFLDDCDDNDASVNPGATDIPNNGIDENCNGYDNITCYADLDNDGYTNNSNIIYSDGGICPVNYTNTSTTQDCNDNSLSIHPEATEICNGIDDDCDGQVDEGGVCQPPGEAYTPSGGGISTTSYCTPNWNCTDWSTCSENGIQTRVCVDLNNCGTNLNKPEETKTCVYVSREKEKIICNANTTVCAGNNVMKCEEGKRWVFVEKCPVVCKNGECISALELNASAEKLNETKVTGLLVARPLEIFGIVLVILLIIGTLIFWKFGKI